MLNLDKLNSQFNLKNLNLSQLSQLIKPPSEKQSSALKLILMAVTLLIVGLIFNDHRSKEQALRVRMSQAQAKIEAIEGREGAIQNFDHFQSSLPKKVNEFDLITLISDYAKEHHITIVSLSPAESRDMGLYDLINVKFDAVCDGFKDMMLFLRNIEKSSFPLRINSWSGNEGEGGKINFSIEISAVLIHS